MKEKIYYQWLPGTNDAGIVVTLNKIYIDEGDVYYVFTDGSECFEGLIADYTNDPKNLKGKAMVRISNPNNKWSFETEKTKSLTQYEGVSHDSGQKNFEIPTLGDYNKNGEFESNAGKINLIPPKNQVKFVSKIDYKDWMDKIDLIKFGLDDVDSCVVNISPLVEAVEYKPDIAKDEGEHISLDNGNNSCVITNDKDNGTLVKIIECPEEIYKNSTNINISNKLFDDNDPVAILVNKSAKFESTISMDLKIDMPSKSLYKIASENFENGSETFINVILSQIDMETILKSLKDALEIAYNEE